MNGRLTFPRKENGSYIRATRIPSGQNVGGSIALATFKSRPPPPSSVYASSPPPTDVPPIVTNSNKIGARNGAAVSSAGVKTFCVSGGTMIGSEFALDPTPSPPMRSVLDGVLVPSKEICASSVNCNLVAAVLFSQLACLSQETKKIS